jgi:hypothetical protein
MSLSLKARYAQTMERLKLKKFTGVPAAPPTEFCEAFVQGMADRMAVSFFKYGPVAEAYPHKVSAMKTLLKKIRLYTHGGVIKGKRIQPGNTEYLMDAANYCMIEFMHPANQRAFFKPTDSSGTAGRVYADGTESEAPHGTRQIEDIQEREAAAVYGTKQGD